MSEVEIRAERNVLGALVKSPERFFTSMAILSVRDFLDQTCRTIYRGIQKVYENDPGAEGAVDAAVLENRVATDAPEYYARSQAEIQETIEHILEIQVLNDRDFKVTVRDVVRNSVLRRATDKLERVKQDLPGCNTHEDMLAHLEKEVMSFTTEAVTRTDIVVMGDQYEEYLRLREKEFLAGNLRIGISTGHAAWDAAIGGGMRDGTLHVVAARSKMGKSWLALDVADNVARHQQLPVLYLDTELEDNYQSDRRVAQQARIPIHAIERCLYLQCENMKRKMRAATNDFAQYPIQYVDIKGWTIDRIISAIRKFFAQYVGKRPDGKYKPGLVVYDYLKLMRSRDKGQDKEYEALGYRMTLLHDLMGEYNNPMLTPAQQNRDGLDKQDESTVSGSDRIIHLCDSFSILAPFNEIELMNRHAQVADFDEVPVPTANGGVTMKKPVVYNTKFKVVVCRQGPGTPGDTYIAAYMDIKDRNLSYKNVCGHIEMGHICRMVREDESGTTKQGGAGNSQHSAQPAGGGTT